MDENFKITDDKSADWALKKIKDAEDERDRLINLAIEEVNNHCENDTKFLKSLLAEYFMQVPHKETKTQETYKLLSGSLVMKKASQKIIKDDEKLIDYFKANELNEFIKVKETPDWAGYKQHVEISGDNVIDAETGEIIEALSIEEVPASFDVKL